MAIMVDKVNKIAEDNKANVIIEIVLIHEAIAVDRASLANKANKVLATNSIAIVIKYLSKLLLDDFVVVFAHIC